MLAIDHQEPDRVPLSLWGSWYGVTDKLYFNALEKLGWEPVSPFRPDLVHSVNYYDDRLLEHLHVDIRHIDPGAIVAAAKVDSDGTDAWGIKWDRAGLYRVADYFPLEEASVEEINDYPFPDPTEMVQPEPLLARLDAIKKMDQEYAVAGRAVASYGFFEMAQSLRKHEQLMVDLIADPEVVHALVARLYHSFAGMTERFLNVVGPDLDLIELPGDDFAGNSGPIISPKMFDQFFREPYRRLIALIKDHSPHLKVVYHSDGALEPFLPRLIDIGVDIVHPLEPLPATDMPAIKAEYGDKLTFMGGIDIREAMQGDEAAVIAEVKTRIRQLAPGGGYILAPANHLQWDVPPENLFTLYQTARQVGRYPLET
jgi:uroporphyrinogen decarboxylase